ncbi:MAG: hypothetical protein EBX41_09390, partial [Chitinophagia bacterium]|nr:hypothetical protein [Chitinophagia bacterium]
MNKNKGIKHINKERAKKIWEKPLSTDIRTLLNAAFSISGSGVVRRHLKEALRELDARFGSAPATSP